MKITGRRKRAAQGLSYINMILGIATVCNVFRTAHSPAGVPFSSPTYALFPILMTAACFLVFARNMVLRLSIPFRPRTKVEFKPWFFFWAGVVSFALLFGQGCSSILQLGNMDWTQINREASMSAASITLVIATFAEFYLAEVWINLSAARAELLFGSKS